eukprot:GHUV01027215.1.p1 GENE.GHUV01027215.1~~GHUV01027215.1.p1  ORF type:complete len:205 (+),score=82.45 GHUV01027215.1:179-793(+)
MQFRLREQGVLKLAHQLATGPPDTLLKDWQQPPTSLFLNKQDKLPDNTRAIAVQQVRQQLCRITQFDQVFEGAAMLGQGVDQLKRYLVSKARKGTWLMPPGQASASTPSELAVELVREKLFRRLNQELPYTLAVATESVRQLPEGQGLSIVVSVTVKSKRVKAIVVGKGGEIIQDYVTVPTQKELSRVLQVPVQLVVTVKVADG